MNPEGLIQLDQRATLWLNGLHSPFTDQLWALFSDTKIWFPAYLFIAFMMFRKLGWKRALIVVASLVVTVVLTDQISNLIKNSVMRLRPCYCASMLEGGLWWPLPRRGFYGFFSGHSSNAFAFAAASTIGFSNGKNCCSKAYIIGIFSWAALVALSRVFMAMHYLGDIAVGMIFGLVMGTAIGFLTRFLIKTIVKTPANY